MYGSFSLKFLRGVLNRTLSIHVLKVELLHCKILISFHHYTFLTGFKKSKMEKMFSENFLLKICKSWWYFGHNQKNKHIHTLMNRLVQNSFLSLSLSLSLYLCIYLSLSISLSLSFFNIPLFYLLSCLVKFQINVI